MVFSREQQLCFDKEEIIDIEQHRQKDICGDTPETKDIKVETSKPGEGML